jgi:hypothetical protein
MMIATAICHRLSRPLLRASVILKQLNRRYIGPVIGAISGSTG